MKRWPWVVAGLVVLLGLAGAGVATAQWAQGLQAVAASGRADATAGLKGLVAGDAAGALTSFERAGREFQEARDRLGPAWLRDLPWLGRQLDAAEELATIGAEGSRAGAAGARLLVEAAQVRGDDRLGRLLEVARPHLDEALSALVVVAERAEGLSTEGLAPPLAEAVGDLQSQLEPMALVLSRSRALLDLERYLFSRQHRFVVLAQNSAQLRPTGGFIGTYGLVELGPEGFDLTTFADIYTLPEPKVRVPSPDGWVMRSHRLRFRTGNWWMDFPTSADTLLKLWPGKERVQPEVDGLVAIDLPTIRGLLKVFGPIRVPETDVALTAANVVEQLSYTVEIEHSGKEKDQRKAAVVSLAKAVMERLTHLHPDEFGPVMASLARSANEKHLQLFLTDADAQADVVATGWSGALDPPEGTTDLLAVSNAVIGRPAKGNLGVDKTLDYQVVLAADGHAVTTLRLGYTKDSSNPLGKHQDAFPNQARVHRGAGTTLTGGKGVTAIEDNTGLPTFSRVFELPLGQSKTVTVGSLVPAAARQGLAPAVPGAPGVAAPADGQAWHYRLLLAKQADLEDTVATVTVTAPQGWRVAGSTAWFRTGGQAVDVAVAPATASVETPLAQDLVFDVVLVRS